MYRSFYRSRYTAIDIQMVVERLPSDQEERIKLQEGVHQQSDKEKKRVTFAIK